MSDSNQNKNDGSKIFNALTVRGDGKSSGGGLGNALAKRDGLPSIARPQTVNISKVGDVINRSAETAQKIMQDEMTRRGGLRFVIDATASREHSWKEAQQIQRRMFEALNEVSGIEIGIMCHRGGNMEDLGWFKSGSAAASAMADIGCRSGSTQIIPCLNNAGKTKKHEPATIILVGDCFEEKMNGLEQVAQKFIKSKTKVYAFLEGENEKAKQAFQYISEATGGVFKKFGDKMDVSLNDLCVAAAVFDMGGVNAYNKLLANGHKGAQLLLGDIKRQGLKSGNQDVKRLGM